MFSQPAFGAGRLRSAPFGIIYGGQFRGQRLAEIISSMPRRAVGLTAAKVLKAKPGRYCDGAGLYLLVRSADAKFWLFRYTRNGKMREAGLGPASGRAAVSLADAREKARRFHDMVREGLDPLDERGAEKARKKAEAALQATRGRTFADVAELYLRAHETSWKNPKHRQQWRNTLRDYVLPVIGNLPVASVGTGEVVQIVEPLWKEKSETASRLRGRIESILDYAKVRGWRDGENPARWRGHLDHLLPARSKIRRVKHHAALPWRDVGAFMAALRSQTGVSARCLEFAILTACRSGEVRGAAWPEVDLREDTWTVPRERMKAGEQHRVPLSKPALAVLEKMAELRTDSRPDSLIFPGGRTGQPLSDVALAKAIRATGFADATTHGFRSCFRDWVAEATSYPRELAEKALAHTLSSAVEAAYQRGDMFDKRRRLMNEWAEFCVRPASAGEVVPIRLRSEA
jgi:integrase